MDTVSPIEGHLLALVWRYQPTTAYFVRKSLERSLASDVSGSPGAVYPALQRLKARGYLIGVSAPDDRRGTEMISVTNRGAAMVRKWLTDLSPSDRLPQDPFRTRIAFADLLEPHDAQRWLLEAQALLQDELLQLKAASAIDQPISAAIAIDNAIALTSARLDWLQRAISQISSQAAG